MKTMSNTPEEMPDNATERPLVTFALFAYNQEDYIREAVEGAFAQTYEPLEIILSDDCSSDGTYVIMQEMAAAYEGPHDVKIRQNVSNLGVGPHVSTVIEESSGEYIAFAAGDDISVPDRLSSAMDILSKLNADAPTRFGYSLLTCTRLIDENGIVFGDTYGPKALRRMRTERKLDAHCIFNLEKLLEGAYHTSGPTRIIKKDLHMLFGSIGADCFTEDIVYLFRCALAGNVVYSTKRSVFYRKHSENLSAPKTLYAKSFGGVERQMRADLKMALKHKLISINDGLRALSWIDAHAAYRSFYKAKLNDERPSVQNLSTLLKARHLSARRKFGIFREYIGVR